jgi:prepilin-type N-terminal cleavage/methylation domain-containing protein
MIRNNKSLESGFTLIETIITLVVLSIAAIGVLSVFTTGMKGSANPLILNQAISLAQEKMDEAVALRQSGGFAAVVPNAGGAFPAPYAAFSWARAVVCVTELDVNTSTGAPPCASGYARVTVTVTNALIGNAVLDTLVTNY